MAYSFFFSYASADERNSEGWVTWFFERLYANLQVAHGRVGKPFFAPGIEAAEPWPKALREALNTSDVLVCLQSPQYFDSEPCGKELDVFLQRRKHFMKRGGDPPDCIIPVLWEPLNRIPPAVPKDFQGKKPSDLLTSFEKAGLYEAILADPTARKEKINLYALNLARRISELIRKNVDDRALPPLPFVPDFDNIPNAFGWPEPPDLDEEKGTGPASVTFVYPRDVRPEMLPWAPPFPPNALLSATALARSKEWVFQGIGFDAKSDFLEKVRWAQDKKSRVVLMLTEAMLNAPELNRFEGVAERGIATIVLSTSSAGQFPPEFPENLRINAAFATRETFDQLLIAKLGKLQANLMAKPTSEASGTIPGF